MEILICGRKDLDLRKKLIFLLIPSPFLSFFRNKGIFTVFLKYNENTKILVHKGNTKFSVQPYRPITTRWVLHFYS